MDFIQSMVKSVQDFYSAIRTLEEFGPESNKNNSNVVVDENTRVQDEKKNSDMYEGLEDFNENSQVDRAVAHQNNNGSQKTSKNSAYF